MGTEANRPGESITAKRRRPSRHGVRVGQVKSVLLEHDAVLQLGRLLDLDQAAAYLGVSPWTVRDLEAGGTIRRVRVPLSNGRELRKLLFDKSDLDRLIESVEDLTPCCGGVRHRPAGKESGWDHFIARS